MTHVLPLHAGEGMCPFLSGGGDDLASRLTCSCTHACRQGHAPVLERWWPRPRSSHLLAAALIHVGKGTRPFLSGGGPDRGLHGGTFTTYWNVRASSPIDAPPLDVATYAGKPFGFYLNFLGQFSIPCSISISCESSYTLNLATQYGVAMKI